MGSKLEVITLRLFAAWFMSALEDSWSRDDDGYFPALNERTERHFELLAWLGLAEKRLDRWVLKWKGLSELRHAQLIDAVMNHTLDLIVEDRS